MDKHADPFQAEFQVPDHSQDAEGRTQAESHQDGARVLTSFPDEAVDNTRHDILLGVLS